MGQVSGARLAAASQVVAASKPSPGRIPVPGAHTREDCESSARGSSPGLGVRAGKAPRSFSPRRQAGMRMALAAVSETAPGKGRRWVLPSSLCVGSVRHRPPYLAEGAGPAHAMDTLPACFSPAAWLLFRRLAPGSVGHVYCPGHWPQMWDSGLAVPSEPRFSAVSKAALKLVAAASFNVSTYSF